VLLAKEPARLVVAPNVETPPIRQGLRIAPRTTDGTFSTAMPRIPGIIAPRDLAIFAHFFFLSGSLSQSLRARLSTAHTAAPGWLSAANPLPSWYPGSSRVLTGAGTLSQLHGSASSPLITRQKCNQLPLRCDVTLEEHRQAQAFR